MPDVTIVYWRDIPAQVIVGKGRRGSKAPLPERFEQAIDRAAMKVGAKDSDAYLSEWHKVTTEDIDAPADELARRTAERIDRDYDMDRLKTLIGAVDERLSVKFQGLDLRLRRSLYRRRTTFARCCGRIRPRSPSSSESPIMTTSSTVVGKSQSTLARCGT